ncbi:hypothetical protein F5Y00DRAFT_258917 [Daldinia vernicosa]|uniref:uncharacterized protein n=1 Tax=Daldinia vernicosa TaxID=114800 RepID=UPI0020079236|nr:uncharacterized protein F5Y00DRAFT_258917 [Daldinia vernicosa]KAI0851961.1 hypothetical protein F5Y00DRAFT_258917 [Daldinia vernicosa]
MRRGVGSADKEVEKAEKFHIRLLKLQETVNRTVWMKGGIPTEHSFSYNPPWGPSRTINSFRPEKSTGPTLQPRLLRQCRDVLGWCIFCATDYATTLEKRKVGHWWERGREEWTLTIVAYHQLGSGRTPADPFWKAFTTKCSSYSEPYREILGSSPRSVKEKWDGFVSYGTK